MPMALPRPGLIADVGRKEKGADHEDEMADDACSGESCIRWVFVYG